ncbi:ABC transporter permease [Williamsia sp. D3]|uniref:ABC transporter permease n=1 Tax=Williamsia sp. D3 TaxID=1313067 RepID=UPI0003D2D3F4|nr:ABC transporter permease [Williamsia sp. D3]
MATATVTPELDIQTRSVTAPKSARGRSHWLTVWPLRILVLVAAAGLWQFLTTADVVLWARFDTVPSVTDIAQAFWTSLGTEEYYLDLGQSLIRIGAGFALAVGVGVPVGILLGRSRIATNTVGTLTEVLRPIPAIALVPVAILVLPTDEAGMVFITFVAAFFPISVATRHAVRALPTIWEDSVLTMGGRKRDVILRVVLPGIAPGVFSGLSVGIGVAWICLISAEMISGRLGVGYRTWQAYTVVDYPQVFVGMLTIGILGALTSGGIELIGRRLTRWLPRAQETR